jgi:hypothetical protein
MRPVSPAISAIGAKSRSLIIVYSVKRLKFSLIATSAPRPYEKADSEPDASVVGGANVYEY